MKTPPTPTIEHDIPIPAKYSDYGLTGTLRKCAVGDSFVVDSSNTIRTSIYTIAYRVNMKVCVRKVNATQLRIWRTQ